MDDQLSRPGTDRRAKGAVTLIDGGTPLPVSSIVYFASERSAVEDQWTRLTSQENLAAVNANPEQFKLLTLFTVPVDELARSPIAHVARAQAELDKIERRRAKAERRTRDRLPEGELEWDDCPDLLDMKAGANELQSAVERATNSSLTFMQIRTADAAAAVAYAKYLTILAGAAQASRCRAQGGGTSKEIPASASQSQAVPSELASEEAELFAAYIERQFHNDGRPVRCMACPGVCWEDGMVAKHWLTWQAARTALFSHSAATGKVPEVVRALHAAVAAIYFDDSSDFRSALGSVVRYLDAELAGECLGNPKAAYDKVCAMLAASPAAPVAGTAEPVAWIRFRSDGGYEGPIMHAAMEEVRKNSGAWTPLYTAPLAAAVPDEEASDPLDWPIPCDLVDGAVTLKKGVALRTVLARMKYLSGSLRANMGKAYQYDVEHPSDGLNASPAEPAPIPACACQLPPEGWACTRASGHEGPCAAVPDDHDGYTDKEEAIYQRGLEDGKLVARGMERYRQGLTEQDWLNIKVAMVHLREAKFHTAASNIEAILQKRARLSKPTAQVTGEPASIDTPEFAHLLCELFTAAPGAPTAKARDELISYIDRHIAAHAPAGRDAQEGGAK